MLISFTNEERAYLREIEAKYKPEIDRLSSVINQCTDKEERRKLVLQRQVIYEQSAAEYDEFSDKCQRERFNRITGGADAIIADAREQAPHIIAIIYSDLKKYAKLEDLERLRIMTVKDGKGYVNANIATRQLKEEFRLHLEALKDDTAAWQDLLAVIVQAVEESPYTDNQDITDEAASPLPIRRARRNPLADITYYGLMNDKVNAQLLQDEIDIFQREPDGQITLRWPVNQAAKNQKPVPVLIALTYVGTELNMSKKLTGFDSAVYNAIATRFYYWQQDNPQRPLYMTPQEIWRTMNGKRSGDGKANPSKAQVKRICDSLDKMRFTRFQMDISKEIEAFNLRFEDERIIGGDIDTYLLAASKIDFVTDKGNTVQGYRISEEPILYTYNKTKGHILYVPYKMLDTSENTRDSENVTEFRNYLLQQIQLMINAAEEGKKGKRFKRNSVILLETIYRDTGILPPEQRAEKNSFTSDNARLTYIRKTRKADRDKIEGILDNWKAKNWIKDYTILNKNNEPLKEKQLAKGYDILI